MRWVFIICGAMATAAMIAISMRLNFLFGASLGQTPDKALVFGTISVVADAWKVLGPIFLVTLVRNRKAFSASAAGLVWIACFLFSVSSAIGIAIEDRTAVKGGRETVHANYEDVRAEVEEIDLRRKRLRQHRSTLEIEALIAARLAQPFAPGRGTVASISANCTKPDARAAEACAEVATLRLELASAVEAARLDERGRELRRRASALRERGAAQTSDPQAELLSRLTFRWLSTNDIPTTLALLLAIVIELVSAFGPVVLTAYADATRGVLGGDLQLTTSVATGRDGSRQATAASHGTDAIVEYMAERIAPAGESNAIGGDEIFADYVSWCSRRQCAPLTLRGFLSEFDRQRRVHDLEAKIRKFGNRYFGIRLSALMLIK